MLDCQSEPQGAAGLFLVRLSGKGCSPSIRRCAWGSLKSAQGIQTPTHLPCAEIKRILKACGADILSRAVWCFSVCTSDNGSATWQG